MQCQQDWSCHLLHTSTVLIVYCQQLTGEAIPKCLSHIKYMPCWVMAKCAAKTVAPCMVFVCSFSFGIMLHEQCDRCSCCVRSSWLPTEMWLHTAFCNGEIVKCNWWQTKRDHKFCYTWWHSLCCAFKGASWPLMQSSSTIRASSFNVEGLDNLNPGDVELTLQTSVLPHRNKC